MLAQFSNARVLDKRSGLSSHAVRVMEKDRDGFIWIGTQSGLNRYDGSQFKYFLHDPSDPSSLLNNELRDIVIDSNVLWAGGTLGISSIDLRDFSIQNIQFDCEGILDSIDLQFALRPRVTNLYLQGNTLWIGTAECGLMRYDIDSGRLVRYSFAFHMETSPGVSSTSALDLIMGFDPDPAMDSIFWLGTAAGLIRFNNENGKSIHFFKRFENLLHQDAINTFRQVIYHGDHKIYYTTWGKGVNIFDPATRELYPLPLDDEIDPDMKRSVGSIRQHDQDNLWLRGESGLYLYNTLLPGVVSFYPNEDPSTQFLGAELKDEKDRQFIATNKGIHIYDPLHEQFLVFSYEELNVPGWHGFARKVIAHPDGSMITILGQSVSALYHFNHRGNRWFKSPVPGYGEERENQLLGVDFEVDEEFGWVFSAVDGVFRFDPVSFQSSRIDLNIVLDRPFFTDLVWDDKGRLWIGTRHEGVLRWDPISGQTKQYVKELYGEIQPSEPPFARNLFKDSRGNIWITVAGGHAVYENEKGKFHQFQYSEEPGKTLPGIAKFAENKQGEIFLVSHIGLLAKGKVENPEAGLEILGSVFPEGMSQSYVEGIIYGEDDRFYVLAANALFRVDSAMDITMFSMDYASFKGDYYCFDKLSESSLVVGLRNKFAVLHSTGLRRNTELPIPYLTAVTINEKPLTGNFIRMPPKLDLRHNENFLSFSFSAISYTLSEQNQFKYRLEGFDPDWIDAGNRRFANYTNIPSGDYAFELQVANNEGTWNPEAYHVPVIIGKAWWATWWFRIGAILVLLTAVVVGYRFRENQIRKETKLKSDFEKKLGDIELSALRAQMNPHFIFNCLNSIENYILKNESVKAAEYINDFARLIRLILQNSRSEYIPLTDEIEALDLYLQMESLRFDNKFDYNISIDESIEPTEIDIPTMLIQPFVENAIWHGLIPKKGPGKLSIEVYRKNGVLKCVIQDDGIGRSVSREKNASMHKRGKKSMGMLITKNRIEVLNELHQTNATVHIIDLHDTEGKPSGTRVELDIPLE